MPFVKNTRIKGLVYVPEESSSALKKHPCPDCFSCQACSEVRCVLCLKKSNRGCIKGMADCKKE